MKISAVIPNYNGEHFLKVCLDSLKLQNSYLNEIIIVDNGSRDGSVDFIENIQKSEPLIKLIKNKENLGFSKAVNQGIKFSSSEFVLLLNNDVEVENDFIVRLLDSIANDKSIFSVASKMIQYNNRNFIDDAGDYYTILGWTKKLGDGKSSKSYSKIREIFSSCAGAALYRKSVFDKIGYLDENFFAYMEDVDIGYRAKIHGFKNIYCPNAIVYHIGSGSSGSRYNEFKIKLAARNNIWVVYKNMPKVQIILNFGFLIAGFLIKYLFFLSKGYGKTYLDGIKEGLTNLEKIEKIEFKAYNLKNYFKIELELIVNTFKLIIK